jgi:hypothetical protein
MLYILFSNIIITIYIIITTKQLKLITYSTLQKEEEEKTERKAKISFREVNSSQHSET